MLKKIRAKFYCTGVDCIYTDQEKTGEEIKLMAVTEGSEENKSFSKWTPGGEVEMLITNPDAFDFYKEGEEYYLDFTPSTGEVEETNLGYVVSTIIHPMFSQKYTRVMGGNKSDKNVTALHDFSVLNIDTGECLGEIHFQQGPIKEDGINGVMNEDLLLMVVTRLEAFQSGQYRCRENALALTKLEEAVMWLRSRTTGREQRGVEGTHQI